MSEMPAPYIKPAAPLLVHHLALLVRLYRRLLHQNLNEHQPQMQEMERVQEMAMAEMDTCSTPPLVPVWIRGYLMVTHVNTHTRLFRQRKDPSAQCRLVEIKVERLPDTLLLVRTIICSFHARHNLPNQT